MPYRLLVDLEAVTFLDALPKAVRTRLINHFVELRSMPERCSDYFEYDNTGRRAEISVMAGYAIHYWIDDADRHIKILAIKTADR